ncbi:hypothetical protein AGMMS49965_00040 [Bacteroidia bacterium]|nr:hypothetical protein AGMMS49965_00040 [Bacteroidia bacterium]
MMKQTIQKSFITFILLLISTMAFSQNIAVESFLMDESDQEARIKSSRKDQNDKVCAIIKVETTLLLQDFSFDAGMVAVTATEQKTGEIWVYLSPGARRLTIQHKDLGSVRNYEFGESLKEATVYIMKLKSGNVRRVVEDDVNLQYFVVNCPIEGATIKIDDNPSEAFSDGTFRKALPYGKHQYTIEAPMYYPLSGMVEIKVTRGEPLNPALQPAFAVITLNGNGDIYVNEERKGTATWSGRLMPGVYQVEVKKASHRSSVTSIEVKEGENKTISLHPTPVYEPEMVLVQGGTFTMGDTYGQDNGATPTHQVTLTSFYIGKYEVTQALWELVMGNNPSRSKNDSLPMVNVSWANVQEFISRLNATTGKQYRLPTEAEWEYAARGGNKSQNYIYSGSPYKNKVAWFNDLREVHPVGTKLPNELGIYDMSGNAEEWCSDWYGRYSSSPQQDPTGPSSGSYHVTRGRMRLGVSERPSGYYFDDERGGFFLGFRLAHPLQ